MQMKKINVRIEQRFIDKAKRLFAVSATKQEICEGCPLALALTEATGEKCSVGLLLMKIGSRVGMPMPPQVHWFVHCFDAGLEVLPFEFQLEY
jgi:hypothetical protein